MINPGFEASLIQPCYSTNMDLYILLKRLDYTRNHAPSQELLHRLHYPPNCCPKKSSRFLTFLDSPAFFQDQIHNKYGRFHYNLEERGLNFQSMRHKIVEDVDGNHEDAAAEE